MCLATCRKEGRLENCLSESSHATRFSMAILADIYIATGEPEKALVEAEADIRNGPRIQQGYFAAAQVLIELNRLQDVHAILKEEIANGLDGPAVHGQLLYISFPEGDRQAQAREAEWFENYRSGEVALFIRATMLPLLGMQGRPGSYSALPLIWLLSTNIERFFFFLRIT